SQNSNWRCHGAVAGERRAPRQYNPTASANTTTTMAEGSQGIHQRRKSDSRFKASSIAHGLPRGQHDVATVYHNTTEPRSPPFRPALPAASSIRNPGTA